MPIIDRKQLKLDAKAALKGNWGPSIGIYVLYCAIPGVLSIIFSIVSALSQKTAVYNSMGKLLYTKSDPVLFIISMIIYLIELLIIPPLIIGLFSYFLKISNRNLADVSELFSKFNIYLKTVGLIFLIGLKTFLWSLLFIVPGIIAAINYSQAYFIMAQNPDVGIVEAIELSKQMMKDEKGEYFVLSLSFIGWILLSILTFFLLFLWLGPYMMTTYANFYNAVSKKVIINSNNVDNTVNL